MLNEPEVSTQGAQTPCALSPVSAPFSYQKGVGASYVSCSSQVDKALTSVGVFVFSGGFVLFERMAVMNVEHLESSDEGSSSVRKLPRLAWLWDKSARKARKVSKRAASGELTMITVGYTPGGVEIQVPETLLMDWSEMPDTVKEDFFANVDSQRNEMQAGVTYDARHHERIDEWDE